MIPISYRHSKARHRVDARIWNLFDHDRVVKRLLRVIGDMPSTGLDVGFTSNSGHTAL